MADAKVSNRFDKVRPVAAWKNRLNAPALIPKALAS